jgi:hypothetical protein
MPEGSFSKKCLASEVPEVPCREGYLLHGDPPEADSRRAWLMARRVKKFVFYAFPFDHLLVISIILVTEKVC